MSTPASAPATPTCRWWVVGILGVTAMTLIAVWFGIASTSGKVNWVNSGFDVVADDRVDVRFDLRRDPDRVVECVLEAQDERHFIIGRVNVVIEPTSASPSRHVQPVQTAGPAVTGYVDDCFYADADK